MFIHSVGYCIGTYHVKGIAIKFVDLFLFKWPSGCTQMNIKSMPFILFITLKYSCSRWIVYKLLILMLNNRIT